MAVLSHDDGANAWSSRQLPAAAPLRREVYGYGDYWERTRGFSVRRELPHAEGVLIFNLGDPIGIVGGDGAALRLRAGEAFVAGAHLRHAFSCSTGAQAGIHVFLPLATLRRLLGVPMTDLVDGVVALDALLGRQARELGEALAEAPGPHGRATVLDRALMPLLAAAPALDRRQVQALALLRAHPDDDIARIAEAVGWSSRHLRAQVRDAVGVGPRAFRRLLRFQRLMERVRGEPLRPDWARLAQEAGYCDQSHMNREFKEFSGLTPGVFLSRSLPDGGGLVER